jgi:hypothetical protein
VKPETAVKLGEEGTVIPPGKTTVIVEAFESAPEEDAVNPMSHESATAAAVVVGTNVTFESDAEAALNVTFANGLTRFVSPEV